MVVVNFANDSEFRFGVFLKTSEFYALLDWLSDWMTERDDFNVW